MTTPLSPENEAFLRDIVARQEFVSRDAALDEAVALMRRRRELFDAVTSGVEQLNNGPAHQYRPDELDRFLVDVEARERQRHPAE